MIKTKENRSRVIEITFLLILVIGHVVMYGLLHGLLILILTIVLGSAAAALLSYWIDKGS